jgi:hypothetical protein
VAFSQSLPAQNPVAIAGKRYVTFQGRWENDADSKRSTTDGPYGMFVKESLGLR